MRKSCGSEQMAWQWNEVTTEITIHFALKDKIALGEAHRCVGSVCFVWVLFPHFNIRINFSAFRHFFFFFFRSSRPSLILVKVNGDLAVRKLFKWRWKKELIHFLLHSTRRQHFINIRWNGVKHNYPKTRSFHSILNHLSVSHYHRN